MGIVWKQAIVSRIKEIIRKYREEFIKKSFKTECNVANYFRLRVIRILC